MTDDLDGLNSLAVALRREAELPLGLRARVEARVLGIIRQPATPGLSRLAAGCGLFLVLGTRPDVVLVGPLAIMLFVVVAAYVRFIGMLDGEEEGAQEPSVQ